MLRTLPKTTLPNLKSEYLFNYVLPKDWRKNWIRINSTFLTLLFTFVISNQNKTENTIQSPGYARSNGNAKQC